jgi:hypothetical protein
VERCKVSALNAAERATSRGGRHSIEEIEVRAPPRRARLKCIADCIGGDARMVRRLTVGLDEALEHALEEAPDRLDLASDAPDAEKLRAYALLGYEHALERELEEARLATYRAWVDAPEMGEIARAASRRAATHGVHGGA